MHNLNQYSYQKILLAVIVLLLMSFSIISCSTTEKSGVEEQNGQAAIYDVFAGREASDISGYESMKDYSGEIMLVDTTVREITDMMDDGKTFAFIAGYNNCPWCNLLMPYVNDAAGEAGIHIGYIDTRKDPAWQSNMDIDDYDLFVEYFQEWLEKDEDDKLHLYTPDMYFIKNGKVVERHEGVVDGAEDPEEDLTGELAEQLLQELADQFDKILR